MGKWRSQLRKVADKVGEGSIVIPQKDGTVAKFPASAEAEAFKHEAARMRAIYRGEDRGVAHPLTVARRDAKYPQERLIFDADRQPPRGEAS